MSDLKLCPFCGSEVDFWTRQAFEAEEYQALIIDCKDCPANMEEWVYKYDKNFAENFEKKKAEMFEAWNKRIERKKGKWIKEDLSGYLTLGGNSIYHCSECGHVEGPYPRPRLTDFCPSCGARLEWE